MAAGRVLQSPRAPEQDSATPSAGGERGARLTPRAVGPLPGGLPAVLGRGAELFHVCVDLTGARVTSLQTWGWGASGDQPTEGP